MRYKIQEKSNKVAGIILIPLVIFLVAHFLLTAGIGYDSFNAQILLKSEIKDSPEVIKIANDIKELCKDEGYFYDSCLTGETYLFVMNNITYKSDTLVENIFQLNNSVEHTLKYGGDCENQAILAIDILKTLNRTNLYLVFQEPIEGSSAHICWMTNDYGPKFYNCMGPGENLRVRSVHKVV